MISDNQDGWGWGQCWMRFYTKGLKFKDLGKFTLKDYPEAIQCYQVELPP